MATADSNVHSPVNHAFQISDVVPLPATGLGLDFADIERVTTVTSLYESVSLVSCTATIHLRPLASGFVHAAFVQNGGDSDFDHNDASVVTSAHQALSQEMSYLARDAPVTLRLSLEQGHTFGHELKGVSLGNNPPALAVLINNIPNTNGDVGHVRYTLTLRARGYDPAYRVIN